MPSVIGDESHDYWDRYGTAMVPDRLKARDTGFIRTMRIIGTLPELLTIELQRAVDDADLTTFSPDDCAPDAMPSRLPPDVVAQLQSDHSYCIPNGRLLWALYLMTEHLKAPVAQALGSPWRVLNTRIWISRQLTDETGPTGWHTDGEPTEVFKVMLYLTETGRDLGGLELRRRNHSIERLNGAPGTWVLFYNSDLFHRGLGPCAEGLRRIAIEITLSPWLDFDLAPRFLGNNARHPAFPLTEDASWHERRLRWHKQ